MRLIVLATLLAVSNSLFADGYKSSNDKKAEIPPAEYEAAEAVVRPFYEVDPDIKNFLDKSYGYVVYPKIGKGAVGVGGAYGKGLVYKRGLLGYWMIGSSELKQATIGLQLGGQTYSEIIFFENETAFEKFKKGKLQLSAQASAVALKKGASANASFKEGVAIFTLNEKGLMGELSVGGQQFTYKPAKKK